MSHVHVSDAEGSTAPHRAPPSSKKRKLRAAWVWGPHPERLSVAGPQTPAGWASAGGLFPRHPGSLAILENVRFDRRCCKLVSDCSALRKLTQKSRKESETPPPSLSTTLSPRAAVPDLCGTRDRGSYEHLTPDDLRRS